MTPNLTSTNKIKPAVWRLLTGRGIPVAYLEPGFASGRKQVQIQQPLSVQAIDTLALNLQNKWVFPDCLAFAQAAIQAQDKNMRAAGCTVLVVIAEGCCDACTPKLADLLQVRIP